MLKKLGSLAIVAVLVASFLNFSYAEEEAEGKKIFEDNKCNLCHAVTKAGIEAKKKSDQYPDLDKLSEKGYEPDNELLGKYLHKKAEINGKKHPMPFRGSDEELTKMLEWLKGLKK